MADMAIAARVQESARSCLRTLLPCVLASLLVACGSGGSGDEPVAAAVPNAAVLSWDPVPVSDVGGYRVYYGTAPGMYVQAFGHGQNMGNVTNHTVTGLKSGTRYYFAVTAFNVAGLESSFSNEVFKDIP